MTEWVSEIKDLAKFKRKRWTTTQNPREIELSSCFHCATLLSGYHLFSPGTCSWPRWEVVFTNFPTQHGNVFLKRCLYELRNQTKSVLLSFVRIWITEWRHSLWPQSWSAEIKIFIPGIQWMPSFLLASFAIVGLIIKYKNNCFCKIWTRRAPKVQPVEQREQSSKREKTATHKPAHAPSRQKGTGATSFYCPARP